MNPTDLAAPRQAIALTYDGQQAPTLSAKGDDRLAEEILAIAREHEVPIYENAELVSLLARLELGDSIPQALYLSIAEIIAFAWHLKGKYPVGMGPDDPPIEKDITPKW
ncbi:EscU/YscU/HrcU family type III secretion system export apparatus switch protein [Pseudomonas sp. 3A(2025)]